MSNLSPSCPFQGKVSSFVLCGHLVSCFVFKWRDEDHGWPVFHKCLSNFGSDFFPELCLCLLSKHTSARLCSFVHFPNSALELGDTFSVFLYTSFAVCMVLPQAFCLPQAGSGQSLVQALKELSHCSICFIWVQMVGIVVSWASLTTSVSTKSTAINSLVSICNR